MRVKLNLATRPYVHRPKLYAVYGILGSLLLVLLVLQLYDLRQWQQQQTGLSREVEQFEVQLGQRAGRGTSPDELRGLAVKLRFAEEILAGDRYRWTGLLEQLEEVIGPGIRVVALTPDFKDKTLRLNGQARKLADLRHFLETLSRTPAFQDHYLLNQQDTEVESGGRKTRLINFSLVIRKGVA